MNNQVKSGPKEILVPSAAAAYVSGQSLKLGGVIGVVPTTVAIGDSFVLKLEGAWDLAAENSVAWSAGDKVYRIATSGTWTKTATGNDDVGAYAYTDKAQTAAIGTVMLPGESIR